MLYNSSGEESFWEQRDSEDELWVFIPKVLLPVLRQSLFPRFLHSDMAFPSLSTPSRSSDKLDLWLKGSEHPEYVLECCTYFYDNKRYVQSTSASQSELRSS